jgi:undecaprenyl-diphosphatase
MRSKIKWIVFSLCLFLSSLIIALYLITDIPSKIDSWFVSVFLLEQTDGLTAYFRFITTFADVEVLIALSVLGLIPLIWKKWHGLYLMGIMIDMVIVNQLLKWLIKRERPTEFLIEATGYSLPSGHTMGAVCFYGFVIWLIWESSLHKINKMVFSSIMMFIMISVIYSRIYLGVHYFTDILLGILLSICILIPWIWFAKKNTKGSSL